MGATRLLLLLLLLPAAALCPQAGERRLAWPLTIDDGVSSGFQEFRSNHFHAGIDLRTLQRTGFPVLAVDDGMIERLTVSRRGYGLSLLLRHAGNATSLYSHLERFRPDIEALVTRVRAQTGQRFFGAHVLATPVAVRRGEVIAFSGESGAGFAHLHVELRDGDGRALNPLLRLDMPAPDLHPPRIRGLLLRSREGTLIDGDCGESYRRLRLAGGLYAPDEAVTINGPCDMVLDAYDLGGTGHVLAPYALAASLDGRPVFREECDRLARDDNNQLGMLYDMAYSTPSTYFFNLCSQEGFTLEGTGVRLAEELRRLPPGRHELRVTVRDCQGNSAQAVVPLIKDPAGEPRSFPRRLRPAGGEGGALGRSEFTLFVNRGDVVVKARDVQAAAADVRLRLIQGGDERIVPAQEYAYGLFFRFQPLNHEPRLQLRFEVSAQGMVVEARQKMLQLAWLKNGMEQTARLGDFAADFGPTSVRDPHVLLLEPVALQPALPLLGTPVRTLPNHFAFLDAVYFRFRVPAGTPRPGQLGIFRYRPSSRDWVYVPTQAGGEPGFVRCRVLTAGTFALLRDNDPPAVSLRRPHTRHLQRLDELIVRLSDHGKGINDESLAVSLNGVPLAADYDPDWGWAKLTDLSALRRGRNSLRVRVSDLSGNVSEKEFAISLK
ncbi:MAG TPA: M23 family metallopeptidase [Candidatus Aminicenantes bacterium]|nr:M23 family metallopeptidase [Candidatus Aminicenantes bacterium]